MLPWRDGERKTSRANRRRRGAVQRMISPCDMISPLKSCNLDSRKSWPVNLDIEGDGAPIACRLPHADKALIFPAMNLEEVTSLHLPKKKKKKKKPTPGLNAQPCGSEWFWTAVTSSARLAEALSPEGDNPESAKRKHAIKLACPQVGRSQTDCRQHASVTHGEVHGGKRRHMTSFCNHAFWTLHPPPGPPLQPPTPRETTIQLISGASCTVWPGMIGLQRITRFSLRAGQTPGTPSTLAGDFLRRRSNFLRAYKEQATVMKVLIYAAARNWSGMTNWCRDNYSNKLLRRRPNLISI